MEPLHFRLRTIMIVIAGLALLMALYPRRLRIEKVPPGSFLEATTVLTIGREFRTRVGRTYDADGALREESYRFIPVEFVAIPIVGIAGSVGLVLYSLWPRRGEARRRRKSVMTWRLTTR
jgi:hypothetical protein